jgi:hypothetical protein
MEHQVVLGGHAYLILLLPDFLSVETISHFIFADWGPVPERKIWLHCFPLLPPESICQLPTSSTAATAIWDSGAGFRLPDRRCSAWHYSRKEQSEQSCLDPEYPALRSGLLST